MHIRAVYPGTFDPVTYGHIDLIQRALKIADEVIVAVAHNPAKTPLFSVGERVAFLKRATQGMRRVTIEDFDSLVVDYCRRKRAQMVVRGLRMLSDFEYEFQMALTNRKLSPGLETIFMMPKETYAYVSARLIKEAAALGADLSAFVPGFVEDGLKKKFASRRGSARSRRA